MIVYYDVSSRTLISPTTLLPVKNNLSFVFGEKFPLEIHFIQGVSNGTLTPFTAFPSGIAKYQISIDSDFNTSTAPMIRVNGVFDSNTALGEYSTLQDGEPVTAYRSHFSSVIDSFTQNLASKISTSEKLDAYIEIQLQDSDDVPLFIAQAKVRIYNSVDAQGSPSPVSNETFYNETEMDALLNLKKDLSAMPSISSDSLVNTGGALSFGDVTHQLYTATLTTNSSSLLLPSVIVPSTFALKISVSATTTFTWPTSITWCDNAPLMASGKTYLIDLFFDGTHWYGNFIEVTTPV